MNKKFFQIALIVLVGISIPGYIIWKNIFPSFEYSLSESTFYGFEIFKKNPKEKNFLVLPELENYFFNKISTEVKTKKPFRGNTKMEIYKGYQALYYKEGESIENKEEFLKLMDENPVDMPNGGLFAYNDSVNILSGEKYHPVFSEELFNKAGYDWDNVKEKGGDFANKLKEGERFKYGDPHPDGTIFKTSSDEYYLIWKEEKRKLVFSDIEDALKERDYSIIITSSNSLNPLGVCEADEGKEKIECEFKKEEGFNKGLDYVINLSGEDNKNISEAIVDLEAQLSKDGFRRNLGIFYLKTKESLAERYGGHLF
ncbi:MAG: hypothetical protein R6V40_00120 [Candidatus Moraniibacteriota bacterium]